MKGARFTDEVRNGEAGTVLILRVEFVDQTVPTKKGLNHLLLLKPASQL